MPLRPFARMHRALLAVLFVVLSACSSDDPTSASPGTLTVTISGLGDGPQASVLVKGPDSLARGLGSSAELVGLPPGEYTITAIAVENGVGRWTPNPVTQTVIVSSGRAAAATVTYALATARMALVVSGLPGAAAAAISITGPDGFTRTPNASANFDRIAPGDYAVTAGAVTVGDVTYFPVPGQQSVTLDPSIEPVEVVIMYSSVALRLEPVTDLFSPVHLAAPPRDRRLFIVEQPGRIRIVRNGQLLATPFLDITSRVRYSVDGEEGLLSIAFDPDFAANGFFYVFFTTQDGNNVVERYGSAPGADVANPAPTMVLVIPHPDYSNHNGGMLQFGPDGMLYISTGDGGGAGDPSNNGQNLNTLSGKILRIDVRTLPYVIPPANPFAGQANRRGEIWAYGLRNPWRFDFDAPPGTARTDLYIADVGQNRYEEINVATGNAAGLNFGWRVREGAHCYPSGDDACASAGMTDPVATYGRAEGCSIIGGHVYRGGAIAELTGQYFYGDFCTGFIASLARTPAGTWVTHRWPIPFAGSILSFGEDGFGELYMLSYRGTVNRIVRQ